MFRKTVYLGASVRRFCRHSSADIPSRLTKQVRLNDIQLKEMNNIISKPKISKSGLVDFVERNVDNFSIDDLAILFQTLGKKRNTHSVSLLAYHLPAFASQLEKICDSSSNFYQITTLTNGLQSMNENMDGVQSTLMTLTKLITRNKGKKPVKAKNVCMMLLGLQNNRCSTEESRKFLMSITGLINSCKDEFNGQEVGNALYGLKMIENDFPEMKLLLRALTVKVTECKSNLSAQEVGNALYGLQSMTNDCDDLGSLIAAITVKVEKCEEALNAQEIGNAVYGLRCMNISTPEIPKLLSVLKKKLENMTGPMNPQAVANFLYGLN